MQSSSLLFVFISAAASLFLASGLDYTDLERMGITCQDRISCTAINQDFAERNCECDRKCAAYNDCCVDASARQGTRNRRGNHLRMQYGDQSNLGVYVTNTCSGDFAGNTELQSKCQSDDISDPLMAVPATDTNTRVTYRNRYCAECNGAEVTALKTWMIKMGCNFGSRNVSNSLIWENIVYRAGENKWGVQLKNVFHVCELQFDMPDFLLSMVRLCRANITESCAKNWRRQNIKRSCESYTAVIYVGDRVYKNPHCALCNHATADKMECTLSVPDKKRKPFSFAILLDVNQSDGDLVGVSRPGGVVCDSNQKYDPYFKKCRNLVCALPGYKMVNGKCRKE